MKRILIFILLSALVGGCAPTARLPVHERVIPRISALSASPYPTLKVQIDSLLADTLFPPSNLGIRIVSLKTHETLYALNSGMLFNPASNEKLFTSATALSTLGEAFPFSTVVSVDSSSRTIFLKGYGDPVFSTADLDSVVRTITPRLPADRSWRVAADVSYFDDLFFGEGWTWDDEPASYEMFLTPLCINSNCIEVQVRPGWNAGDSLRVQLRPPTSFVTIENRGTTVKDSVRTPLDISRKWRERTNIITVSGEMLTGDSVSKTQLSVWQPERYAALLFAERLRANGVRVDTVLIDTVRAGSVELFRFSHRMDSVVTNLNKVSDNLSAETILKTLGAELHGVPGSAQKGLSVVKEFLARNLIDTTKVSMVDGSGLSRYDLTSPDVIVQLLEVMQRDSAHFPVFYSSLPIAGVDGTIDSRMRGSTAEGNLHAKTGTLSAVTALSGYVRTADAELLAFSILMQNYVGPSRPYRGVQDRIGIFLSGLKRANF